MNLVEKGRAIDTFINDPDCRVFLMSLKAGGVALNLTVASHVSLFLCACSAFERRDSSSCCLYVVPAA
jgi:hypothetical protein